MAREGETGERPKILLLGHLGWTPALVITPLVDAGFELVMAQLREASRVFVNSQRPRVVLLNVFAAPQAESLLRDLQPQSQAPLLVLAEDAGQEDKIRAFELGADDYLVYPFSPRELVARVRAHLRPSGPARGRAGKELRAGPLTLRPSSHDLLVRGKPVAVAPSEYLVLQELLLQPGKIVPSVQLARVLRENGGSSAGTLRVILQRLRAKIELDPQRPTLLITIPRQGVLLAAQEGALSET